MRITKTKLTIILSLMFANSGCGSKTSAGRNGDVEERRIKKKEDSSDEKESSFSCFSAVKELPETMVQVCEELANGHHPKFAAIQAALCHRKQLSHLLKPECGWQGSGSGEPSQYIKVVNHTDLNSTGTDFYYFGAYSLTLKRNNLSFRDILHLAHSDPNGYKNFGYKLPKHTIITPISSSTGDNGSEELTYRMDIVASVGSTHFRSTMKSYQTENGTDIIFDEADGIFDGIKQRNALTIAFELPNNSVKVVVLEEKEIPDRGLHDIAKKVLKGLDISRMKLYYENSLVH